MIVGHHCRTRTQQQILNPSVSFSLPSEALLRVTRMDPSPPNASGTYLSVIFFSTAYLYDTCSCDMIYLHREEIPRYVSVGIGIGELGTKRPRPHGCNRIYFVAKTESVLDGGTCEHLSMTLLRVRCRPEVISIRTSPTLFIAALLSCPG